MAQTSSSSTVAKDAALLESIDLSTTTDLHRSNLMRMQVTELLEECQLDLQTRKWSSEAHEYLQLLSTTVKSKIGTIQKENFKRLADKPVSVKLLEGLTMEPIGCTKTPIGWTKKTGNAQVLPTFTLMILLPTDMFASKDYLNYRYFDKRNIVLKEVAQKLAEKSKALGKIEYVWSKGMDRSPYLQLVPPSKKKAPKFQVHLYVGMRSIDWIPKIRLVPNRCNIKDDDSPGSTIKGQLYNQSLLYDARHEFQDQYLHDLVENQNVEATLVLIQIWALQRGLWRNHDGWDKESMALLLVYLLRTHKINSRMTPVQIFTVVLQKLASTNWLGEDNNSSKDKGKGDAAQSQGVTARAAHSQATQFHEEKHRYRTVIVLPLEGRTEAATIQQSELSKQYRQQTLDTPITKDDPPTLIEAYSSTKVYALGPVFLDPTMTYNYLGDVSPNYMRVLQSHARKSLETLKNSRSAFQHLFMRPARFWDQWDLYVQITCQKSEKHFEVSTRRLIETLKRALGNRIHGMRLLTTGNGDIEVEGGGSDCYPSQEINKKIPLGQLKSPMGDDRIIIGLSINPETSQRVVDRGPPSDHHEEVKEFVKLWGKHAQLRRFKDGAIVQAVVWNEDIEPESFQNEDKWNGGYVAKITKYIVNLHYANENIKFSLPTLLSVVDGMAIKDGASSPFNNPLAAHQNMMKAFTSLSDFLRNGSQLPPAGSLGTSKLGLPLPIEGVEPLSPCLRYSELFPPVPHPLLGGGSVGSSKKMAGAIVSDPILIQLRFGASSKWPTDLKAIGAAKTAMLIQLANGIESSGGAGFDGPVIVTPSYADVGYKGYCFRIVVRADPEIRLLRGLKAPSPVALKMLEELSKKHMISSSHHSTAHANHTLHPSAGTVVRIAKRWVDSHLLSGLITVEAIELMVAKVYSDGEALMAAPGTVMAGFLRFLHLLATHNWARDPLVVDPRDHISDDDYDIIMRNFENARGIDMDKGPPMYIIAPYNKGQDIEGEEDDDTNTNTNPNAKKKDRAMSSWQPSVESPEWVVVKRAAALAKRSYDFMTKCLKSFDEAEWSAVFRESTTAFKSYSVLFRVHPDLTFDESSSSTSSNLGFEANEDGILESAYSRSMKLRFLGPKPLRRKNYRNLQQGSPEDNIVVSWQPVRECVRVLRRRFSDYALFFFNELSPEVIGVVWRPNIFSPMTFSVMNSDYAMPIDDNDNKSNDQDGQSNSMVIRNANDLIREMSSYYKDIVITAKVFDESCFAHRAKKRKLTGNNVETESSDDESK